MQIFKAISRTAILCAALLAPLAAASAQSDDKLGTGEGEVRRIDKSAQKLTLRHGPIAGLDMEAMTMVFRAADPAMLDKLKVGDKIKFTVRQGGGALTLEAFEPTK